MRVVVALTLSAAACLVAQPAQKKYAPPRMEDGHPNMEGVWSNATITPLERPADLASKPFFTEKEAAAYEQDWRKNNNMDRRDGGAAADVGRAYNDFWWDRGNNVVSTRRTSLVVDPPDGRVPALTPAAQKRADEQQVYNRAHPSDGPENRGLSERCLVWRTAGPPMVPGAYNNNYQVIQSPGYFVILNEMIHDVRVIPVGDRQPHLEASIHEWLGDSRGHWEGDTLIVDTMNFSNKVPFRGSDEKMHLTERFTRTGQDTLLYQYTVDDPSAFTKPFTVEIPSWRTEDKIYEYACHEGNYGMEGILSGARKDEKKK